MGSAASKVGLHGARKIQKELNHFPFHVGPKLDNRPLQKLAATEIYEL